MAICNKCGKKYSKFATAVSAKGVCQECFEAELKGEVEAGSSDPEATTDKTASGVAPVATGGQPPVDQEKDIYIPARAVAQIAAEQRAKTKNDNNKQHMNRTKKPLISQFLTVVGVLCFIGAAISLLAIAESWAFLPATIGLFAAGVFYCALSKLIICLVVITAAARKTTELLESQAESRNETQSAPVDHR